MGKVIDLTGQRFGKLVVKSRGEYGVANGRKCIQWICDCDCGNKDILISGNKLKNGSATSCGCDKVEKVVKEKKQLTPEQIKRKKLIDYFHDICIDQDNINYAILDGQIKKMIKNGMTYDGIRYSLWFAKEHKGMSILNINTAEYFYNEAKEYYNWLQNIKAQLKEWKNEDKTVVAKTNRDREDEDIFV